MSCYGARNNQHGQPSSAGQGLLAQMSLSEMSMLLEEILAATEPATCSAAASQKAGCVGPELTFPREPPPEKAAGPAAAGRGGSRSSRGQEGKETWVSAPSQPLLCLHPVF